MEIELSKKKSGVIEREKIDSDVTVLKQKKMWRKKVFSIIFLVFRFINIMKIKIISMRIWEAKPSQLNIIGDSIFYPEKNGNPTTNFQGFDIYKRNMILIARERVFLI